MPDLTADKGLHRAAKNLIDTRYGRARRPASRTYDNALQAEQSCTATTVPETDCCFPTEASARLALDETRVARPERARDRPPIGRSLLRKTECAAGGLVMADQR